MKANENLTTHFNLAVEQDRTACDLNDPKHYEQARDSYNYAIDIYTHAFNSQTISSSRKHIENRIQEMKQRKKVMENWLEQYRLAKLSTQTSNTSQNFTQNQILQQPRSNVIPTNLFPSQSQQPTWITTPTNSEYKHTSPMYPVANLQINSQPSSRKNSYPSNQPPHQQPMSPIHPSHLSHNLNFPSNQIPSSQPNSRQSNNLSPTLNVVIPQHQLPVYPAHAQRPSPLPIPSKPLSSSSHSELQERIQPKTPTSTIVQNNFNSPTEDSTKLYAQQNSNSNNTAQKSTHIDIDLHNPIEQGPTNRQSGNKIKDQIVQNCHPSNLQIQTSPKSHPVEDVYTISEPNTSLEKIVGLKNAKESLKEAIILPQLLPSLYETKNQQWKTFLLYGPRAVGKSSLVTAIVSEAKWKLFTIHLREIIKKMMTNPKVIFEELFRRALNQKGCVIYLKNIEILFRNNDDGCCYEIQQCRGELIKEIEKLKQTETNTFVVVNSTIPWSLDEEIIQYMDRRIYIGLPDLHSRSTLLEKELQSQRHDLTLLEIENIARECDGFTCRDLQLLVRDAKMETLRLVWNAKHFKKLKDDNQNSKIRMIPCDKSDSGAIESSYTSMKQEELYAPSIRCLDFDVAMAGTKPSVKTDTLTRYEQFTRDHGCQ